MKPEYVLFASILWLSVVPAVRPQSLADLAKKEAERRKLMDQQGAESKSIRQGDPAILAPNGNLSTSSIPRSKTGSAKETTDPKPSLQKIRTVLQKLDGEIRREEERLASLQRRLEVERDTPVKLGRVTSRSGMTSSHQRLLVQIEDVKAKIRRLKGDRLKTYDSGRKAGFLPGELDGKYVRP